MNAVKICGLSRPEDIRIVNRVLPDFIGFIFAPSRRHVDADTATNLKEKLDRRIQVVGVFANQEIEAITALYKRGVIDLVQLHGDEDTAYIKRLRQFCTCKIIKAVRINTAQTSPGQTSFEQTSFEQTSPVPSSLTNSSPLSSLSLPQGSDYLLFDAAPPLQDSRSAIRGGTGKSFDWNLLAGFTETPYFLAGGLTENNVGEALRLLSPFAVDVSSGVETNGTKDEAKINAFVLAVRKDVSKIFYKGGHQR